jgi:protein SCO1/2
VRRRLAFAAFLCTIAVLAAGAAGCGGDESSSAAGSSSTASAEGWAGAAVGNPKPVPDFALHDENGKLIRLSDLRGKAVLVTFLYTHCPDVCPIIAANLNSALESLSPSQRNETRVLAVSVDPKGDTKQQVQSYVKIHRLVSQFHYLIGSKQELAAVWRKFDVQAVARDPDLVDHTAYTLLVDPQGNGIVIYPSDFRMPQVLHDLRKVLSS